MSRKVTAALLITAAVLTTAAFTVRLVVFGLLLLRRPRTATAEPARARSTAEGR